jgi:outer membrane immunogenic protein
MGRLGGPRFDFEAGATAMKKFLLGTIGLIAVAMAAPAIAADLPAQPYVNSPVLIPVIYDWSGFYTGVNGGWGTSHKCWDQNTAIGGTFFGSEGCHNANGGTAGGQLGYRWQASSWVFGVEGQGNWADLKGSSNSLLANTSLVAIGQPLVNRSQIAGFGLLTGHIGYAFDTALFYIKGGAAIVADRFEGMNPVTGVKVDNSGDQSRWGGTAGVGFEYAFLPNWSAAIEYDHLFMGTKTLDFAVPVTSAFTREDRIKQDADIVTVRVNYRWGGPVISKY